MYMHFTAFMKITPNFSTNKALRNHFQPVHFFYLKITQKAAPPQTCASLLERIFIVKCVKSADDEC